MHTRTRAHTHTHTHTQTGQHVPAPRKIHHGGQCKPPHSMLYYLHRTEERQEKEQQLQQLHHPHLGNATHQTTASTSCATLAPPSTPFLPRTNLILEPRHLPFGQEGPPWLGTCRYCLQCQQQHAGLLGKGQFEQCQRHPDPKVR